MSFGRTYKQTNRNILPLGSESMDMHILAGHWFQRYDYTLILFHQLLRHDNLQNKVQNGEKLFPRVKNLYSMLTRINQIINTVYPESLNRHS